MNLEYCAMGMVSYVLANSTLKEFRTILALRKHGKSYKANMHTFAMKVMAMIGLFIIAKKYNLL